MGSNVKKIALILSSVRPVRVGPNVVDLVHEAFKTAPSYASAEITLIDIASFNLPVFNEKAIPATVPAMAQFEHEHSKKWSAAIAPYDGYIFVTPEYNGGPPGAVKNALDYLYNEWSGKPIFIVSYGIHGGSLASKSLQYTFEIMKLRVIPTRARLPFVGGAHGTDLRTAMFTGQIGEESKKIWEQNPELISGFEELIEFLNDPTKQGTGEAIVAAKQ